MRKVAIPGAHRPERGRHRPRRRSWPARSGGACSAGLVFGIALSVASTVVLIRVLSDNRQLHTPTGHIAVGWLVVEDMFTVLVLVLMPAVFGAQAGTTPAAGDRLRGAQGRRARRVHHRRRADARSRGCSRRSRGPSRASCSRSRCSSRRSGSQWRRRRSSACRWRSAPFSPGWSSADRSSASAPPPTRCRCATRSPCCSSSRSACSSTPRACSTQPLLIAATLAVMLIGKPLAAFAIVAAVRIPAEGRPRRRRRARADRRVLVHRRRPRQPARRPAAAATNVADRRGDRLDHAQPAAVPRDRPASSAGCRGARPARAAAPPPCDAPGSHAARRTGPSSSATVPWVAR